MLPHIADPRRVIRRNRLLVDPTLPEQHAAKLHLQNPSRTRKWGGTGKATSVAADKGKTGHTTPGAGKVTSVAADKGKTGHTTPGAGKVASVAADKGKTGHTTPGAGKVTSVSTDKGKTGHTTPSPGKVAPVAAGKGKAQPSPHKPSSSNEDVIRTTSKCAANIPQTPKSPPRRTVSSSSSSSADTSPPREKELRKRLNDLRLSRVEVTQNKNIVEELRKNILVELRKESGPLRDWETVNSGSYYDQTKVRTAINLVYLLTI